MGNGSGDCGGEALKVPGVRGTDGSVAGQRTFAGRTEGKRASQLCSHVVRPPQVTISDMEMVHGQKKERCFISFDVPNGSPGLDSIYDVSNWTANIWKSP